MMPCLTPTGHHDKDGYLRVYDPATKRQAPAHRLAFRKANGYLPSVVRHSCDNPACVEPSHLLAGSQGDNMRDMVQRGRLGNRSGELNNQATLADDKVAEIRRRFSGRRGELSALAREFGVSRPTISNYVRGVYR